MSHTSALAQKGLFPAGHPCLAQQRPSAGPRTVLRVAWGGTAQTLDSGVAVLIFREAPGGGQSSSSGRPPAEDRRGSERSGAGRPALGRWRHSASGLPSVRCSWFRQCFCTCRCRGAAGEGGAGASSPRQSPEPQGGLTGVDSEPGVSGAGSAWGTARNAERPCLLLSRSGLAVSSGRRVWLCEGPRCAGTALATSTWRFPVSLCPAGVPGGFSLTQRGSNAPPSASCPALSNRV